MDSMLVWGLIATIGLAAGIGLLAGYLGFVAGRRDFLKSRLPGNATRASKANPTRKAPTDAQLNELNLYQKEGQLQCLKDLPFHGFFRVLIRSEKIVCNTCKLSMLLVGASVYRAGHDDRLCIYCPNCFQALVFPNVTRRRRVLGLPKIRGNFLDILETLKNDSTTQDTQEPEKKSSFTATVEGTGGLRQPPMRVRVDPEAKTVRPVEDETALAEAELADHQASEAAKKALPN